MNPTPQQERELFEQAPAFVDLLSAYRDPKDAFQNYAAYAIERYRASAEPGCECCKGPGVDLVRRVTWVGNFTSRRSQLATLLSMITIPLGHASAHWETIRFQTEHRLCTSCSRGLTWRSRGAEVLRYAAFATLILLGAAMVAAFVTMLAALFVGERRVWWPVPVFIVVLSAFIFTYRFTRRANGRFLPRPFAAIAKKYFVIDSIRVER